MVSVITVLSIYATNVPEYVGPAAQRSMHASKETVGDRETLVNDREHGGRIRWQESGSVIDVIGRNVDPTILRDVVADVTCPSSE